jgi:hypothetical protein
MMLLAVFSPWSGRHRRRRALTELRVAGAGVTGFHAIQCAQVPLQFLSDKPAKHLMTNARTPRVFLWRLLPLLLAALPCAAQPEDPLKSAACGAALADLQAARQAQAAGGTVEALRSAAAVTCLGTATPPTRPGRVLQAPIVVPPPQVEVPARAAPLPAPVLPPPPVAVQRPPGPVLCDAGGCWAGDGTHLQHLPPSLIGPRGLCTQQGGLVYCP